jgi:hypothetical protein
MLTYCRLALPHSCIDPFKEDKKHSYVCTVDLIKLKMCQNIGELLFSDKLEDPTPSSPRTTHLNAYVDFQKVKLPYRLKHPVEISGIYCILGLPLAIDNLEGRADVLIHFENAHGLLPAIHYAKKPVRYLMHYFISWFMDIDLTHRAAIRSILF